jgi:5'-methylthioadenosine nucleosidase
VPSTGVLPACYLQGAAIGDVFVSTAKMHHDRRIPLPGFEAFGIGHIASTATPKLQVRRPAAAVSASTAHSSPSAA